MSKIDLYNGDCLEVMKNIPNKSVDMILCDLPYGTTACKWDTVIPFEPLWEQYKRIIKDSGAIVLFANEPFASQLRMSNIKLYKYDWIWLKNTYIFIILQWHFLRIKEALCFCFLPNPIVFIHSQITNPQFA